MNAEKTVLVVDDEPILRQLMAEWLESEGFRVLTAEDGLSALKILETEPADAIVTDIRMPRMDGVSLLKKVHESSSFVPSVIFVTGFADINPREAYALGAEAIISKPFTDEQLLSAVRRTLTPRDQRWKGTSAPGAAPLLKATFPTQAWARATGELALGRGGFCLQTQAIQREGPVRFELAFTADEVLLDGHGAVRWIRAPEREIGVEITGLKDECIEQACRIMPEGNVYIPATARP